MKDKELIELAAKAAGYEYLENNGAIVSNGVPMVWNPLLDDGDALRLAVKLHINTRFLFDGCNDQYNEVWAEKGQVWACEDIGMLGFEQLDECAATRRAIVCAAAKIGKAMT